ncbi:MAG: FAD binding domain-containing protein [Anaerolineales bacterium]|nr:FAD binding domain-containing protein [Anaerolineales bacterium]
MSLYKNYCLPYNIKEALEALTNATGPTRIIAGGTDLLLDLKQGRHPPVHTLVDVTQIHELSVMEIREGRIFIGASVPLNRIVSNDLVRTHLAALVEACGLIGGPQVRNTATLGGNVAHALPAADGTIAMLALGADAEIASMDGNRLVALEDLFLGPGKSALDPKKDLLVGFFMPLQFAGQSSAFKRVMRPQGVALPILNMAAWLERQDGIIRKIRLSLGPAGPTPFRARKTESVLMGKEVNDTSISAAQQVLLDEAKFRTSPARATADYRKKLAIILLEDVLKAVWKRADRIKS